MQEIPNEDGNVTAYNGIVYKAQFTPTGIVCVTALHTRQFNLLLMPYTIYFKLNIFAVYYFNINTFDKCF